MELGVQLEIPVFTYLKAISYENNRNEMARDILSFHFFYCLKCLIISLRVDIEY